MGGGCSWSPRHRGIPAACRRCRSGPAPFPTAPFGWWRNGWSRVDLGIVIAYENDLEQAIRITEQVALQMYREPAWRDKIREPPEMHGVDDLGERGITLRIWIKVQPLQQWRVTREYRRRLKHAFDQAGIQIPFPQQALWFRSPLEMRIQGLSPEETHRLLHPMESRLSNPDPISEERAGQLPP